ncbi:TraH family protein [Rhizobium sp. BT-226]|uniref:TraH family protein n=1 Tax=Rhizobium sp. BT-226 TaxID=2986922 RepID=UPI0021F6A2C6|nr:TraH family protein [Rhizobium sp. BT-226]MCW0021325.1 TraH family protein [Rhizobium sp. BT-226]
MLDAILIQQCADPSVPPAIIEQFIEVAGSPDPLAVTVKSGGRLILVPKAKTPEEAMETVRVHIGHAVVRVGLTQFPAGVGIKDASELKPTLVDACENLRMGTRMFAKIMRIVARWYGDPKDKSVLPQVFDDAVHAWKTGEFEGTAVFQAPDPGTGWRIGGGSALAEEMQEPESDAQEAPNERLDPEADIGQSGIRIDLSRIGGN